MPAIGPGEILVRVEACGICHTDLKKIEYDLLPPPRVFGHETAGVVAAVGEGVTKFRPATRSSRSTTFPAGIVFTASTSCTPNAPAISASESRPGTEKPAGGGFAQYVRVMDWIVRDGVEKIPAGRLRLIAHRWWNRINTCLKAVVQMDPQPRETVAILGQGPIGLMFTMLVHRTGARIFTTDTFAARRRSLRALRSRDGSRPA